MLTLAQVSQAIEAGYAMAKAQWSANPTPANERDLNNLSFLIASTEAKQAILDNANAHNVVLLP